MCYWQACVKGLYLYLYLYRATRGYHAIQGGAATINSVIKWRDAALRCGARTPDEQR